MRSSNDYRDDSSDDDDDDDDLDSYRNRLNSVRSQSSNGQPDLQMMKERSNELRQKTNQALNNSLRIAQETQAIGDSTLVELHRQGERLDGVSKKLDNIENDLSYSQKVLKVMRRPFGWIRGTKVKETEPTYTSSNSDNSSKRSQALYKVRSNNNSSSNLGSSHYDDDFRNGEDDIDGDDEDSQWRREVQNEFKQQDETLDEISGIMSNLKMVMAFLKLLHTGSLAAIVDEKPIVLIAILFF